MTISLAEAILILHPELDAAKDFTVVDKSDGNGPFIMQWNTKVPKPTDKELDKIMKKK